MKQSEIEVLPKGYRVGISLLDYPNELSKCTCKAVWVDETIGVIWVDETVRVVVVAKV